MNPSSSILAEPPVAVVDKNVDQHGTRAVAEAYLKYLVHRSRPRDRREEFLPATQRCRTRQIQEPVPRHPAVHHHRCRRAAGKKYSPSTSPITAFSISSISRKARRPAPCRLRKHSVIPGFGLTLGYTLSYLSLIVLIPLSALAVKGAAQPGRNSAKPFSIHEPWRPGG